MSAKKRLLSGVQASGRSHIGNYFGAMRQFVELSKEYESFVFIADYHSLTTIQNPDTLRKNIFDVALDYLAIGLDAEKVALFKQSDLAEHTELAWIFDTFTTVPYLMRAHAYKDKTAQGIEASVGLFNYPMLMAADILLYDPDVVPVGQDQKQHVEYARDTAQKFNSIFGETFKLPKELITKEVSTVPGTDGQKMSKSYKNTIPLFAPREELEKAVMNIVTDSSGKFPEHVYAIHKLYRPESELKEFYQAHTGDYKNLKEALIEDMDSFIAPMREKRHELEQDRSGVLSILRSGAERARMVASAKMKDVRKKIGVTLE